MKPEIYLPIPLINESISEEAHVPLNPPDLPGHLDLHDRIPPETNLKLKNALVCLSDG
jgi:hypothetical protein